MRWVDNVKASGVAFGRWAYSALALMAVNTVLLLVIATELFVLCARSV